MSTLATPHHNQDNQVSNLSLIKYLDIAKWQNNNETDYHWQGDIPLSQFSRLYATQDTSHHHSQNTSHAADANSLYVEVTIKKHGEVIIWQLLTKGQIWQTCQRCLEPVAINLDVASKLALLSDETHSALIEQDIESMLLDELTQDNKLWLLPMIEDELLVALPLAPKHDDCQLAVSVVGDLPDTVADKPNPFAVLASLKQ